MKGVPLPNLPNRPNRLFDGPNPRFILTRYIRLVFSTRPQADLKTTNTRSTAPETTHTLSRSHSIHPTQHPDMASGNTTTSTDTNLSLFHTSASTPHVSPNPLRGRVDSTVLELLDQLHERSIAQEGAIDPAEVERVGFDDFMRDKFIALDQDKCWFAFQMCLAAGARNVVEVSEAVPPFSSYANARTYAKLSGRYKLWGKHNLPRSRPPYSRLYTIISFNNQSNRN